MNSDPGQDATHWLAEGQRLFRTLAERLDQLHRTITQLEHDNEILRAQRDELLAAFDALAGNVTQVVDEVLQRFRRENREAGSGSAEPDGEE